MPRRRYSEAELEAAIEALSETERFREAEELLAAAAPKLQAILAEALASGGWFEESQQRAVAAAAAEPEGEARITAVRTLLAEENRISMMVGVAVGWALAEELARTD